MRAPARRLWRTGGPCGDHATSADGFTQIRTWQARDTFGVAIELRHLRAFVTVAEERHFRRAAERLHIAQPPLSRQIRALEEEVGAELFDRGSRPIRLTAAGGAFLEDAQFILDQTRRAIERGDRTVRGERGHLSVAALPWAYSRTLPSVVRAFRASAPHASLELSTRPASEQAEAVAREWVDIAFSRPMRGEARPFDRAAPRGEDGRGPT